MHVCISLDYIDAKRTHLDSRETRGLFVHSNSQFSPVISCLHFGEEGSVLFYLVASAVKSRISTCAEHIMFRAMSLNYLISKASLFLQDALLFVHFLVNCPDSVRAFEDGF
jgi:hypothetical protein